MHTYRTMLSALLLSLVSAVAQAQARTWPPSHPRAADQRASHFSLARALALMRASHPLLKAQEEEITALQGDARQSGLWSNPMLESAYLKGMRQSSYDPIGYTYHGVTQFMELAGAPGTRRRQGNLFVDAARADRRALEVQLSLDVELALIDLVAARRAQDLLTKVLALLDSAGQIVNERVHAGAAPRYDAARMAVSLAIAQADHTESRAALARAWAEFRAAVGPRAHELGEEPDYDLEDGPALPSLADLLDLLQRMRPDVVAARARAHAAEVGVQVARRSVFQGLGVTLLTGFGAGPNQVDLGAGVSIPLPVVNRGQGAIPAARARVREAEALVDAVAIPASLRITGMREEVERRRQALRDYQARAVASGDEMLSEARAGYLAGRFSVLELADAYRAFRDARLRQIALGAAARQAEVELGRELGRPLRDL